MKIMVGYDGSNAAWDALILAQKHARAFDAKIHIATSLFGGDQVDGKKVKEAEKSLEYAKNLVEEEGLPCKTHLLIRGLSPGEDLVKFANEKNIEQIVIGVRRRSNLGKIIFGSTARYVILEAKCPVLTIK